MYNWKVTFENGDFEDVKNVKGDNMKNVLEQLDKIEYIINIERLNER